MENIQIGIDFFTSYIFDASAKTITIVGIKIDSLTQVKPVVNSVGVDIFNPLTAGKYGTLLDNVITLEHDTTSMNDADDLYICVKAKYEHWVIRGEKVNMGDTSLAQEQGEDVWRGNELSPAVSEANLNSIPTPPGAGESMFLVCEDANDTIAGTGVQKVKIHYTRAFDGKEYVREIDTNGTTPVSLVDTDITFINDFHSFQLGTAHVAVGNIKIYRSTDTDAVYSMIYKGGNQALVSRFKIPSDKFLVLDSWRGSEAKGKRTVLRIRSTDSHGILIPGVYCFKDTMYINKMASGNIDLGDYIPSNSIVKISAWGDQAGSEAATSTIGKLYSKS